MALVFVLQWLPLHCEILIMLCQFHRTVRLLSCWFGRSFWSSEIWDVPWEDVFKLGISTATTEFCEWVQVGSDVHIPHRNIRSSFLTASGHSSPWFSAAFAAAIAQRNYFFRVHQRNNSSASKVKFWQASDWYKGVLQAPKLAYS